MSLLLLLPDIPYVHVLHAHDDIAGLVLESTVESDNVLRVAVVHDAQLAYDSLAYFVLRFDVYDLADRKSVV